MEYRKRSVEATGREKLRVVSDISSQVPSRSIRATDSPYVCQMNRCFPVTTKERPLVNPSAMEGLLLQKATPWPTFFHCSLTPCDPTPSCNAA